MTRHNRALHIPDQISLPKEIIQRLICDECRRHDDHFALSKNFDLFFFQSLTELFFEMTEKIS